MEEVGADRPRSRHPDPVAAASRAARRSTARCAVRRHRALRRRRSARRSGSTRSPPASAASTACSAEQIDADGLHRTRSAKIQLQLLVELTSLKQALRRYHEQYADEFDAVLDRMHRALDAISLGTGEPAYFNGTGQLPHDVARRACRRRASPRMRDTGTRRRLWPARRRPRDRRCRLRRSCRRPSTRGTAHSSALSLRVQPRPRPRSSATAARRPPAARTRSSSARASRTRRPTINALSANPIRNGGALAGRLVQRGDAAQLIADEDEDSARHAHPRLRRPLRRHRRAPADAARRGQDPGRAGPASCRSATASPAPAPSASTSPPGTEVEEAGDLVRIRTASRARWWSFLWDGAELRVEDSVRQSAYFGFHRPGRSSSRAGRRRRRDLVDFHARGELIRVLASRHINGADA